MSVSDQQARVVGTALALRMGHARTLPTLARMYLLVELAAIGVVVVAHRRGKPQLALDLVIGHTLARSAREEKPWPTT